MPLGRPPSAHQAPTDCPPTDCPPPDCPPTDCPPTDCPPTDASPPTASPPTARNSRMRRLTSEATVRAVASDVSGRLCARSRGAHPSIHRVGISVVAAPTEPAAAPGKRLKTSRATVRTVAPDVFSRMRLFRHRGGREGARGVRARSHKESHKGGPRHGEAHARGGPRTGRVRRGGRRGLREVVRRQRDPGCPRPAPGRRCGGRGCGRTRRSPRRRPRVRTGGSRRYPRRRARPVR